MRQSSRRSRRILRLWSRLDSLSTSLLTVATQLRVIDGKASAFDTFRQKTEEFMSSRVAGGEEIWYPAGSAVWDTARSTSRKSPGTCRLPSPRLARGENEGLAEANPSPVGSASPPRLEPRRQGRAMSRGSEHGYEAIASPRHSRCQEMT